MSPHNPHDRRRAWAPRTEAALRWIRYTADGAAGVMYVTGWAQASAIAAVVGVGATAGSRTALWWATRLDHPDDPYDAAS